MAVEKSDHRGAAYLTEENDLWDDQKIFNHNPLETEEAYEVAFSIRNPQPARTWGGKILR